MSSDFDRRSFLKGAAVLGAGSLVPGKMGAMAQNTNLPKKNSGAIPRRQLGKTGIEVSAIGMGGYHLGSAKNQQAAVEMVARAIDAGITFFDNAWDYHDGQSEEYLGAALKGKRDQVVVMTKVCTHGRGKDVAMQQLEQSLRRLQTDHLDVWQIHEVIYWNDPDLIFRPGGAIEALTLAKQQGKVRAVGFTGHKDPRIHLAMLEHNYPFDTVQMPLNCLDATFRSFEQHVLPEAQKRGIAVLGMKSMGGSGEIVTHGTATPEEALRYAMSLPVATTISGMESMEVLEQNIAIASSFQPMSAQDMQALRDKVKFWASDGRFERFKTTKMYDGAEGRKQHEYPPTTELPA
ncbi:MAG TPA: aldo/keto reductase [Candidatus Koribacter sp.]|jgi:aryl-alcohol dehydrogenase-like predicted oxidoreductase